jgi:hypothetical protein
MLPLVAPTLERAQDDHHTLITRAVMVDASRRADTRWDAMLLRIVVLAIHHLDDDLLASFGRRRDVLHRLLVFFLFTRKGRGRRIVLRLLLFL